MAKEWAKPFYNGKKWNKCKDGYKQIRLLIDGGLCEVCHKEPGYIVHHKIPLTRDNINNPEVSLNYDNLSYECKSCHDKHEGHGVNGKGNCNEDRIYFDEEGQPIPPIKKNE